MDSRYGSPEVDAVSAGADEAAADNLSALAGAAPHHRLRLLSFNIQAGIATRRYREYLTQGWKHVLPDPARVDNLDRIAGLLDDYDLVGLQEVDGGSLRSGFINQTEYLALAARYPYWYDQRNRDLGKFAQHSLGVLSRFRPTSTREIRLPGMIPGRGALMLRFGHDENALHVIIMHLALGKRARMRQLAHIVERVCHCRNVVLMGDLNCRSDGPEINWLLEHTDLREPVHGLHTFPSWRPQHSIDHILVSPSLQVRSVRVLNHPISDHLPIEMEVELPSGVHLAREPVRFPRVAAHHRRAAS